LVVDDIFCPNIYLAVVKTKLCGAVRGCTSQLRPRRRRHRGGAGQGRRPSCRRPFSATVFPTWLA